MTLSKFALSLLAVFSAATALAQSTPNPLMRPVAPSAPGAQAGAQRAPSMPPVPSMTDGFGRVDKSDERVRAAQSALARFNVVAIQDDTAILRVTAADNQASSAPTGPGAAPGEGSGAASKEVSYGVLPSMVVKHKQRFMVQDVEAIAEVQAGQIRIASVEGRALYQGRLDGNSGKVYRGFAPIPSDSAYTARQAPPVGTSSGAAAAVSGSNAGQGRTDSASN